IVSETRGLKTAPFHPNYAGGWIFFGSEGIISATSLFDLEGNLVRTFEGKAESHFANFLKAVRSRKREDLNAEILEGHQSTSLCHIGNISWQLGRQASPTEIREAVSKLKVRDDAAATLDSTLAHLRDNDIDPEQTKPTL